MVRRNRQGYLRPHTPPPTDNHKKIKYILHSEKYKICGSFEYYLGKVQGRNS